MEEGDLYGFTFMPLRSSTKRSGATVVIHGVGDSCGIICMDSGIGLTFCFNTERPQHCNAGSQQQHPHTHTLSIAIMERPQGVQDRREERR